MMRPWRSASTAEQMPRCRALYVQLVEHHREIYADPSIGRDDPASGFDEYLTLSERVISWVAVDDGSVVGLAGLLWEGSESTTEPVIVDCSHRRNGIGRRLVETAIEESRRRATDVDIKPVRANASAVGAFHRIDLRTLGYLQLFISLDRDESHLERGLEVHGRPFKC